MCSARERSLTGVATVTKEGVETKERSIMHQSAAWVLQSKFEKEIAKVAVLQIVFLKSDFLQDLDEIDAFFNQNDTFSTVP